LHRFSKGSRQFLNMKFIFWLNILYFIVLCSYGQNFTIRGYVTEAGSGEFLVQANIYEKNSLKGTSSNNFGFYSFTLPMGKHTLVYSYVGYKPLQIDLFLTRDTLINISLLPISELGEIVVRGENADAYRSRMLISQLDIPVEKIQSLPSFLGEADVFKTLKLMPGVQSGNEGQSGLYIRGGGPDQNLVLLDGIPVYNAEHLFGIFSVFNPDMVKNIDLYKGGFPARYGGRLSSVIDITSKDGNLHEYKGSATIGMISSKMNFEGPIFKGKTSFNISARRSYIDIVSRPVIKAFFDEENYAEYYFYDLNAKINHIFSERSRLFLNVYYGYDDVVMNIFDSYILSEHRWKEWNKFALDWSNQVASIRWNYLLSQRLFSNFTLFFTTYDFYAKHNYIKESEGANYYDDFDIYYGSKIGDAGIKIDFDHFAMPGLTFKYGYHFIKQGFFYSFSDEPKNFSRANLKSLLRPGLSLNKPWLHQAYAEGDLHISGLLHSNMGLHGSVYMTDEQNFMSLQPRVSLMLLLSRRFSLNGSYTRMTQFLNLLSSSTFSMPSDLWLPATKKVPPPIADQFSVGARFDFGKGLIVNIDAFTKTMKGLIEYKEGINLFENKKDWEDKVETGRGFSDGIEFLAQKTDGKTTGWIGYTLSWTRRQFDNLNNGNFFWAKYDRRHDIGLTLTHKFNKRVDAGIIWVFGTGSRATLPTQQIRLEGLPAGVGRTHILGYFSERNNYRLPNYHRLDAGINLHKFREKSTRTWRLGFINTYNQRNPFYLYVGYHQNRYVIKQVSIFPVLPTFSYTYSF